MLKSSICLVILCILGGSVYAGSLQGVTRDLDRNPLQGIQIQAFEIDNTGRLISPPFNQTVSGPGGVFTIDLQNRARVVVLFDAPGRSTVFLPEPPRAGNRFGGAISGTATATDFDVFVPRPLFSGSCEQFFDVGPCNWSDCGCMSRYRFLGGWRRHR